MSEWTILNKDETLLLNCFEEVRVCLPSWHDLHSKEDNLEKLGIILLSLERLGWLINYEDQ